MDFEKIIKEYLLHCANICNRRGSYSLYLSKESIRKLLIDKFKNNDYNFELSDLIKICEEEVFSYIDKNKGLYGWAIVDEEELMSRIKNRIDIALQ
jgi:predicted transcriptional regulator